AMLIAFIGLIALINGGLGWVHSIHAFSWLPGSMQGILGRIFAPIAWLLGVKWNDCATVGNLLGTRLILNEFVAFVDLGKIGSTLDQRSFVIATYALCGFANLSSVAIQVGGIRELARRGVNSLVLTNAAGGIDLKFNPGDLVLISDHINLLGVNPLTGPNDETLGPRFPDMSDAYSREYREIAKHAAAELGITLREGVYAAVPGPSYETPAEIRYLRTIGADLVGMSTVPETIVANHMGMKVVSISCVTNMAAGILPKKLTHAEVLETGERVKETLAKLLHAVVIRLPAQ